MQSLTYYYFMFLNRIYVKLLSHRFCKSLKICVNLTSDKENASWSDSVLQGHAQVKQMHVRHCLLIEYAQQHTSRCINMNVACLCFSVPRAPPLFIHIIALYYSITSGKIPQSQHSPQLSVSDS